MKPALTVRAVRIPASREEHPGSMLALLRFVTLAWAWAQARRYAVARVRRQAQRPLAPDWHRPVRTAAPELSLAMHPRRWRIDHREPLARCWPVVRQSWSRARHRILARQSGSLASGNSAACLPPALAQEWVSLWQTSGLRWVRLPPLMLWQHLQRLSPAILLLCRPICRGIRRFAHRPTVCRCVRGPAQMRAPSP